MQHCPAIRPASRIAHCGPLLAKTSTKGRSPATTAFLGEIVSGIHGERTRRRLMPAVANQGLSASIKRRLRRAGPTATGRPTWSKVIRRAQVPPPNRASR